MSSDESFKNTTITQASLRNLFLAHVGQTSEAPLALHITKAKGTKCGMQREKNILTSLAE